MLDYVIPGNDDAVKSIKVILGVLNNAVAEANGNEIVDYISEDKQPKMEKKNDKRKDNKKEVKVQKELKKEEKVEVEEEKIEEPKKETKIDLNILTVSELRELAKKKEIKGYSKMKKEELIENLK